MKILLVIIFVLFVYDSYCNDTTSIESNDEITEINPALSDSNKLESIENVPIANISDKNKYQTKSPTMAIVWSLVFPGGGQIYVGSYWKAPLFAGATGFLAYNAISNHNTFKDLDALNSPNKEIYRNNRDISIFFICGVYILAAVDAYVGAHLYDFDVSDDLSFSIMKEPFTSYCINARIRF